MEVVVRDWSSIRDPLFKGDSEAAVSSMTPFGGGLPLGKCLTGLGYYDEGVFSLLEDVTTLLSPAEIESLYQEVATRLREVLPFTTLYPGVLTTMAHHRVKGLRTPDKVPVVAFMED